MFPVQNEQLRRKCKVITKELEEKEHEMTNLKDSCMMLCKKNKI